MITKRIIPCLDVKNNKVVKGIQFKNHQIVGSIMNLAKKYSNDGADELVFYDISASTEGSIVNKNWVSKVADVIDIPFCVAGGIKTLEDARQILNLGADKISINTPALINPNLISQLSNEFGSQCVVIGMDIKFKDAEAYLFAKTGNEKTAYCTNKKAIDWLLQVQDLGAGEVVINAMGQDGVKTGYDLELLRSLERKCSIPIIASGGAGNMDHFYDVFNSCNVDGALAASVFHKNELGIEVLKNNLLNRGIRVRR